MILKTDVDRDLDRAGLPTPAYDAANQCWVLDFGPDSPGHPIVTAATKQQLDRVLEHVADGLRRARQRRRQLYAALQMEAAN